MQQQCASLCHTLARVDSSKKKHGMFADIPCCFWKIGGGKAKPPPLRQVTTAYALHSCLST